MDAVRQKDQRKSTGEKAVGKMLVKLNISLQQLPNFSVAQKGG